MKILVADDSRVSQKFMSILLEDLGHSFTTVGSGGEVVEAAANGSFDIIIMDIQMPGIDGFEAATLIRAEEALANKRTPIIAMTASVMEGDLVRYAQVGIDRYIAKPVSVSALMEALQLLMSSTTSV
jgi:two-component system sensor histidine kinase/response regulator